MRPYDYLFKRFLPALEEAGLTDRDVRLLTAGNPKEAFAVRPRIL